MLWSKRFTNDGLKVNYHHPRKENQSSATPNRLGTFGGVFTPSILTILGVIFFMRAGFVIGQAGIFQALLILCLASSITVLTSLSISAVSTNTPVAGGGAYFLISRALGPEFGGAIGLALFCAQTISVPLYILGFTEALVRTFPGAADNFRTIALITTAVLFLIAYVGASWAIRTQYVIMSVLGVSILVILTGAILHFQKDVFAQNWTSGYNNPSMSFWKVFAIYFPAVTGIMAGVSLSGDLKNPRRSIPAGTVASVIVGFFIYSSQILLCGGAQSRHHLLFSSFETFCNQAVLDAGFLVVAGVFAATLSSAIGSFLGAPRVLQAVARDRLIPMARPFASGSAKGDEPHRALWLTLAITMMIILWAGNDVQGGAFDILAAGVTMFFLYTYGMINLAAFVESVARNPSFRPRFKYYHWTTAMAGMGTCTATALLINFRAAAISIAVLAILYAALRKMALQARFGDARWGFVYSRLRNNLLQLSTIPAHPKNWRPTILVLTGNPATRFTMVKYALWIGEERGLVTLARILVGDLKEIANHRQLAVDQLNRFLQKNDFDALTSVVVSQRFDEGLTCLLQGHPINPLQPNIVLMGWLSDVERCHSFVRHMTSIQILGMSLVVLRDKGLPLDKANRRIDIWWRGRKNGYLMVLLSHLLTLNWEWSKAEIRLFRVIQDKAGILPTTEALRQLVDAGRVDAKIQVIFSKDTFQNILRVHSKDASVVFIGFNVPEERESLEFQKCYEEILSDLPTTLMVCSSGKADLLA